MSRGDGLEIDSAISSTALSLQYLHFCKFWRYFIQFNYHLGSARAAISTSSPNALQSLPSTTTPSPASSESSSENPVKTRSSKLPMLHSFLYKSFTVATNSFFPIFPSVLFLVLKRYNFFALKWDTWSQASKPSERILSNFCTFSVSHQFSLPLPRSPSVFSPHLLSFQHSNLASRFNFKKLVRFSPVWLFIRPLEERHNPIRSSCGRGDRTNSTRRYCQVFRRHFYRVFDLSTINVVPVWILHTPVLSLLLHNQHIQNFKSQAPLNALSARVSRMKTDRNRNISSSTTSYTTNHVERS